MADTERSTQTTPAPSCEAAPSSAVAPGASSRWLHPWREMERELERFFNRPLFPMSREWPRFDDWFRSAELELPAVDVIDRDTEVVVRAQVPGMTAADLDVTLAEQSLTLRGHKRTESEETGEFHRREISAREFVRTVALPAPVDPEKASASCKDGLLEITLPKKEAARKQKLTIQNG